MERVFAIGDIHGCVKTFRKLMTEINPLKSDIVFCLGDYIDRGKDSKGVIDLILDFRANGYTINTLRGNHEQIMMDSVRSKEMFWHWIENGGDETLTSFGVNAYSDLGPEYKTFFEATEFYATYQHYIFVHAGLNFKIPNPFEDKVSMLWIRGMEIDNEILGHRTIVHGHTPISIHSILDQRGKNVINIDGGCVYNHVRGLGNLIGLNLKEEKFIAVPNAE